MSSSSFSKVLPFDIFINFLCRSVGNKSNIYLYFSFPFSVFQHSPEPEIRYVENKSTKLWIGDVKRAELLRVKKQPGTRNVGVNIRCCIPFMNYQSSFIFLFLSRQFSLWTLFSELHRCSSLEIGSCYCQFSPCPFNMFVDVESVASGCVWKLLIHLSRVSLCKKES